MKHVIIVVLTILAVVTVAASDKARELKLQQAIDLIESKGDLAKATPLLEDVAKSDDRALAARGLLHLAQAQERYGKGDALATYKRIVDEFTGATGAGAAVLASARSRMTVLAQRSVGLMAKQLYDTDIDTISPDGRFTIFTDWKNGGDLAVQDLGTGKRTMLVKGDRDSDVYADGAVASPDSQLIAYGWENGRQPHDLRVISVGGGQSRIIDANTEGADSITPFDWTPDGRFVLAAVERERDLDLVLIPASGGPRRVIKRFSNAIAQNFRLSHDGRFVAYDKPAQPRSEPDLFAVSVQTGMETQVLTHPARDYVLDWFPADDRLLFGSDRGGSYGIWAVRVVEGRAEGEPVLIRAGTGHAELLNNSLQHVAAFSKAGDFYYSIVGRQFETKLVTIDPTTSQQVGADTRVEGRYPGLRRDAVWSPDGTQLAYLRIDSDSETSLRIQSLATGEDRSLPLPAITLFRPVWFPDGSSVLVGGRGATGQGALWTVNVETGQTTTIADSTTDSNRFTRRQPALSPDGRQMFFVFQRFVQGAPAVRGIGVRDLITSEEHDVTTLPFGDFALSPDGRWLALTQPLRIVASSGDAQLAIANAATNWTVYEPPAWSPDGRSLFVVKATMPAPGVRFRQEIWRVPVGGAEPMFTGISHGASRISVHPDGRRLALSVLRDQPETWVLQNLPPLRER